MIKLGAEEVSSLAGGGRLVGAEQEARTMGVLSCGCLMGPESEREAVKLPLSSVFTLKVTGKYIHCITDST